MKPKAQNKKSNAFTLIELLIVVAIIAILAAIAVPNFLEAQTRAKVTRVKADMRTLVVGLESYRVDNNRYVREHREPAIYGDAQIDGENCYSVPYFTLSTPIAYLSNAWLPDPFSTQEGVGPFDACRPWIRYYDLLFRKGAQTNPASVSVANYDFYGDYRMLSYGPNRDFFNRPEGGGGPDLSAMLYDPTNGTLSDGNIWRSPKNDGVQPSGLPILAPH